MKEYRTGLKIPQHIPLSMLTSIVEQIRGAGQCNVSMSDDDIVPTELAVYLWAENDWKLHILVQETQEMLSSYDRDFELDMDYDKTVIENDPEQRNLSKA